MTKKGSFGEINLSLGRSCQELVDRYKVNEIFTVFGGFVAVFNNCLIFPSAKNNYAPIVRVV